MAHQYKKNWVWHRTYSNIWELEERKYHQNEIYEVYLSFQTLKSKIKNFKLFYGNYYQKQQINLKVIKWKEIHWKDCFPFKKTKIDGFNFSWNVVLHWFQLKSQLILYIRRISFPFWNPSPTYQLQNWERSRVELISG